MVSVQLACEIMKIMRPESCRGGCAKGGASANLEAGSSIPHACRPVGVPLARRLFMVWQTPAATDIRFGFEITLYVAAR
jgi:coenzyme PQQ precursor peptide PqqA